MHARMDFFALVLAVVCLGLAGCSSSTDPNRPKTETVTGTVTFEGKPLTRATIKFLPTGETKGQGGSATTDDQGKYSIEYTRGGSGLPAGKYKVVVSKYVKEDGTVPPADADIMSMNVKQVLPPYYTEERTRIVKEVPKGGGTIDLDLK